MKNNNQKRTSTQVAVEELRKRATQGEQQASLLLRTATKLEKEEKNDQATAMKLQAADLIKLAADMRKTADDLASQEEILVVEAEVTEEVTETPVEEAEVTEEVTETPVEEAEVTEEVTETPVEEAEVTEEVTETPEEETEATEEVTEIPEEEVEVVEEPNKKEKKSSWIGLLWGALALCLIVIFILAASLVKTKDKPQGMDDNPATSDTPSADTLPEQPADPAFDMDAFTNSVINIAKELTDDENIAANVDIFVENIGEDKLVELIEKRGELNVQKAIAEMLVFVPEIKMNQYISNNGLAYNPNATEDYYQMIDDADKVYTDATGKNPNGALMSLEGYDTHKSNREAMKALITETGDVALLTWYEAKTNGYDAMAQQNRDTETANAYKDEVKLELVNSVGTIKLLELQMEKEANGEITVMDNVSMQYTDAYNQFILGNYMYVVAK